MSDQKVAQSGPRLLAASCAGGMARQYRVQVFDREHPAQWTLVGSFRDQTAAGQCAERLNTSGRQARVIACQALPTAA